MKKSTTIMMIIITMIITSITTMMITAKATEDNNKEEQYNDVMTTTATAEWNEATQEWIITVHNVATLNGEEYNNRIDRYTAKDICDDTVIAKAVCDSYGYNNVDIQGLKHQGSTITLY